MHSILFLWSLCNADCSACVVFPSQRRSCQVAELPYTQFFHWRFHQATKQEHNSKFQWYFVTCIRYFWKKKYVVGIQTCQCHFSIIIGKLKSLINVLFCTTSLQLQCLAGLEPACLLWLKVLSVNLNEVFESQLYRHSQYKLWTFHKNGLSAHKPANFHFLFTN